MQLLKNNRNQLYITDLTQLESAKSSSSFRNIVTLISVSYLGLFAVALFIILMAWLGGIPIYF